MSDEAKHAGLSVCLLDFSKRCFPRGHRTMGWARLACCSRGMPCLPVFGTLGRLSALFVRDVRRCRSLEPGACHVAEADQPMAPTYARRVGGSWRPLRCLARALLSGGLSDGLSDALPSQPRLYSSLRWSTPSCFSYNPGSSISWFGGHAHHGCNLRRTALHMSFASHEQQDLVLLFVNYHDPMSAVYDLI